MSDAVADKELKEAIDWFGGYLKESFPEYFDNGKLFERQPGCTPNAVLMQKWKEEAGKIPETTCSAIDKVIKYINSAIDNCESAKKARECDCENCEVSYAVDAADDAIRDLDGLECELESLREDNERLRELGKFWYEKCEEILKP